MNYKRKKHLFSIKKKTETEKQSITIFDLSWEYMLVPEELWTEVCDIVQEAVIKTIPKNKKCKKSKWLSEEALQIAMKRREVKSKGEKERYKHLNV